MKKNQVMILSLLMSLVVLGSAYATSLDPGMQEFRNTISEKAPHRVHGINKLGPKKYVEISVSSRDFQPVIKIMKDGKVLLTATAATYVTDSRTHWGMSVFQNWKGSGRYEVIVTAAHAGDKGEYELTYYHREMLEGM